MAKTFSSLDSLVSYIKHSCHPDIIKEIGDGGIETMKKVTEDQVEDSKSIVDCIGITNIDNESVELAWQDNGDWFSVAKDTYGQHWYAPWSLENGKTFEPGKPMFSGFYHEQTTLAETSKEIIEKDSVETYKRVMRSRGFKVR